MVGVRIVGDPGRGLWRRGTGQGFGELSNPALDQQTTGQFDQILWGNIANPFALTLLRQALLTAFGEIAVVARGITLDQITHLCRLRLPEGADRFRRIKPIEKDIADTVFTFFDSELIRAEITRTLAIDRDDLVGQQAQVVLRIGVTDAETQASLVLCADMRHTETGTTDLGAGINGGAECMGRKAQPEKHTGNGQSG